MQCKLQDAWNITTNAEPSFLDRVKYWSNCDCVATVSITLLRLPPLAALDVAAVFATLAALGNDRPAGSLDALGTLDCALGSACRGFAELACAGAAALGAAALGAARGTFVDVTLGGCEWPLAFFPQIFCFTSFPVSSKHGLNFGAL